MNRFAYDNESGFVFDRSNEEWLDTAEAVYHAMGAEIERLHSSNSPVEPRS